mgnify:CR=1 FL=1
MFEIKLKCRLISHKLRFRDSIRLQQQRMAQEIVPPSIVLQRGLRLVGFTDNRQSSVRRSKNIERFHTHFGSSPGVYAAMWSDLQTTAVPEALLTPEDMKKTCLEHFLMATHFLKCYSKENQNEGTFKLCDTTIRKWVWHCVKKIQALKAEKIVLPQHWNPTESPNANETTFTITVDGIHCRIFEPSHGRYSKNPEHYSHKFKQAGLGYEIALSVFENRCVWMNGPFPAGKNDVSIFRSALKANMKGMGIADKGYRGEAALLSIPTSHDTEQVREFKSRALARHEKFNGQLKNFAALSEKFRHGLEKDQMVEKHQSCFEAVTVICQCQLENGSPLVVV